MSLAAIQVSVELAKISCGGCGGTYAINERYRLEQFQKSGSWTCPYCKMGWGYSGKGENETLKRELAAERERIRFLLAHKGRIPMPTPAKLQLAFPESAYWTWRK